MARTLYLLFLLLASGIAGAQVYSDHGTPLLAVPPCACSQWQTEDWRIDSVQQKLKEVTYTRAGANWKRTYFLTTIDSTWKERCLQRITCGNAVQEKKATGWRTWFRDEALCSLLSFSLPPFSGQSVVVKDVARLQVAGACQPVFSPEVVQVSRTKAADTITVSASLQGQVRYATIIMLNPALKAAAEDAPQLAYLQQVNSLAVEQVTPALQKADAVLYNYFHFLGQWRSNLKTVFNLKGDATVLPCAGDARQQVRYKLTGSGEAGLYGYISIPVGWLPAVGTHLGASQLFLPLSVSALFSANDKTDCLQDGLTVQGRGPLSGHQLFALRSTGYFAEGEIMLQDGGLQTTLTVLPSTGLTSPLLRTGQLRIKTTVEDKWGFAKWRVEYQLWKGADMTLPAVKQ